MAEEQAALKRVAKTVAHGTPPAVVLNTIAGELGFLLRADYTGIKRYEPDQTMSVLAFWHDPRAPGIVVPKDGRLPIGDACTEVLRTGRPTRRTSASCLDRELGSWLRTHGIGHNVVCPVTVDGRVWGVTSVLFRGLRPPPEDTEERMGEFTELAGCSIAQAESRTQLFASRARLVAASDATRRRIERDLHDGAQQRLISLGLELRAAQENVPPGHDELMRQLSGSTESVAAILAELQEISRGLHPATLARAGLAAGLKALAHRCPVPVTLDLQTDRRLTEQTDVTLYYIVCETLANVAKHANASKVWIHLDTDDERVHLEVHDDGVGGADPLHGSGLIGLNDRVEALSGTMRMTSPAGEGTSLVVTLPLES